MLTYALLTNTILFGLMALTDPRTNSGIPPLERRGKTTMLFFLVLDSIINISYFLTFPWIIFSNSNYLLNIGIALLMQFVVNHLLWAILLFPVLLITDGISIRRKMKQNMTDAVLPTRKSKQDNDGLADALGQLKGHNDKK